MNRTMAESCCTTPRAIRFWGITFVILYASGQLLRQVALPIAPYGDTISLASLALACLLNFQRHRTLHCGLTGPLFGFAAVAAALVESDAWRIDERTIWAIVLPLVGAAFFLEWRFAARHRDDLR